MPLSAPALQALSALLSPNLSDSTTLSLLQSLSLEAIFPDDLTALFDLLWQQQIPVPAIRVPVMDCCGTGGSGLPHFNTSTSVAFVLAAAGIPVVKFGNRSATGASGSFDFLEALGLSTGWPLDELPHRLAQQGIVFLSAGQVYPTFARLAPYRKQLGKPTIFNLLGPLLNPVQPTWRLMGVSHGMGLTALPPLLTRYPHHQRSLLVRADNGLDEIAVDVPTHGVLCQGAGEQALYDPWQAEPVQQSNSTALNTRTPQENVHLFQALIQGQATHSAEYSLICRNAGTAFWVAGHTPDSTTGYQLAADLLASGAVAECLHRVTQGG